MDLRRREDASRPSERYDACAIEQCRKDLQCTHRHQARNVERATPILGSENRADACGWVPTPHARELKSVKPDLAHVTADLAVLLE
jgi:hypothetical protein